MTLGAKNKRPKDEFIKFGDVGDGCAKDDWRRRARATAAPAMTSKPGDLVDYQSVIIVVWLAMAVVALFAASLLLVHTRRVLARQDQSDHGLIQARFAPQPAPVTPQAPSSIAS